jgi:multidrug efflux pump subunit AcrA (membrane-fusion protein)
MIVTCPSRNKITQGYKSTHHAYDFSGRGDLNAYACQDCKCIQSVDRYVSSWISTPPLTTRDYGNFAKFLHTDGTFSLYAHLERGSVPRVGDVFAEGERVATIGNTGNSTGTHLHFEYRNAANINQPVEFKQDGGYMPPDDGALKELQERYNKLEEEYKLEQQRVVDCRNDRTDLLTQIDRMRLEFDKERDDLNVRIAAAEAGQKAEKEARQEIVRTLSTLLQSTQNWPDIEKAIVGLIGIEDLLNKERKAHNDTVEAKLAAERKIKELENEVERLEKELKKAKGIDDASTHELVIEVYQRIISRLKQITRR